MLLSNHLHIKTPLLQSRTFLLVNFKVHQSPTKFSMGLPNTHSALSMRAAKKGDQAGPTFGN
jgi:hypothetical protein